MGMLVQFRDRTSSGVTPYPIGCADPASAGWPKFPFAEITAFSTSRPAFADGSIAYAVINLHRQVRRP